MNNEEVQIYKEKLAKECSEFLSYLETEMISPPVSNSIETIKANRLINTCHRYGLDHYTGKIQNSLYQAQCRYREAYLVEHFELLVDRWNPNQSYKTTLVAALSELNQTYSQTKPEDEFSRLKQDWLRDVLAQFMNTVKQALYFYHGKLIRFDKTERQRYLDEYKCRVLKLTVTLRFLYSHQLLVMSGDDKQVLNELTQLSQLKPNFRTVL